MPKLSEIECTETGSFEDDTKKFLKDTEIKDVIEGFDQGGLNKINKNIVVEIKRQMGESYGLSPYAFNINGRAPLNDLSKQLTVKLGYTEDDVETLKGVVQAEGNQHRYEEADTYFTKAKNMLKEIKGDTKSIMEMYNKSLEEHNAKAIAYNKDPDHTDKKPTYDKLLWDDSTENIGAPIPNIEDAKSSINHYSELKEKYSLLGDFAKKYQKAEAYLKECEGLERSLDKLNIRVRDGAELPEGVQPRAKCKTTVDEHGQKTEMYTNPDGSTVEIKYNSDGEKTTVINSDNTGLVTSETTYDPDGKEVTKIEYKYERTEASGIYTRTETVNGKEKGKTFAYVNKQGNYITTDKVDRYDIMGTQEYDGNGGEKIEQKNADDMADKLNGDEKTEINWNWNSVMTNPNEEGETGHVDPSPKPTNSIDIEWSNPNEEGETGHVDPTPKSTSVPHEDKIEQNEEYEYDETYFDTLDRLNDPDKNWPSV